MSVEMLMRSDLLLTALDPKVISAVLLPFFLFKLLFHALRKEKSSAARRAH